MIKQTPQYVIYNCECGFDRDLIKWRTISNWNIDAHKWSYTKGWSIVLGSRESLKIHNCFMCGKELPEESIVEAIINDKSVQS